MLGAVTKREMPDRFEVAFSLAGEDRPEVIAVAESLERRLGPGCVFLDEWFEFYLAGGDADLKLQRLYRDGCDLAVFCVSGDYGRKPWTRAEHAAIRARYMEASLASSEAESQRVLPLRVGDGEVGGVLFNTICPDIRGRPPEEIVQLIVDRLDFVKNQYGATSGQASGWPADAPVLHWPMADHGEAQLAFANLLTQTPPYRFLPVEGATETGKTHISKQMLANALKTPGLACGRLDFKGTTDMEFELQSMVQWLGVPAPPNGIALNEKLGAILEYLKGHSEPSLLIFDTYEGAGEASEWLERVLLPELIRSRWLRVVVVGQQVPDRIGAIWESISSPSIVLVPPEPEDWYDYGQKNSELTLDFVRQAHDMCRGKPGVLAALLGSQN